MTSGSASDFGSGRYPGARNRRRRERVASRAARGKISATEFAHASVSSAQVQCQVNHAQHARLWSPYLFSLAGLPCMIHHAASFVPSRQASFPSILLAAAGQAWSKTRPRRVPLNGSVRGRATGPGTRHNDVQTGKELSGSTAGSVEPAGPSYVLQYSTHRPNSSPLISRRPLPPQISMVINGPQIITRGEPTPMLSTQSRFSSNTGASAHTRVRKQQDASTRSMQDAANGAKVTKARPPRPHVWCNPWSRPVSDLHADAVSEREAAAADRGRDQNAYESDPPWPEIAEALSASGSRPCLVRYGPIDVSLTVPVAPPSSPSDLCRKLVFLRALSPQPSLEWLIQYHANHRQFHSVGSFNLLIAWAIRMARRGTAESLFLQMQRQGVKPDIDTRALRVRYLVRFYEWSRAWTEQQELSREEGKPLPLAVWLEFLDTEKRGALRIWSPTSESSDIELKSISPVNADTLQIRYQMLMQNKPSLTAKELSFTPTGLVYRTVRHLISMGQLEPAVLVTEACFRRMPPRLPPSLRARCQAILHLHFLLPSQHGQRGHFVLRELLYRLLELHGDLRPNATTLFLLMRPLLRAQEGGSVAERLVDTFVRRWGSGVVDDRVLRRLASLLCREGRLSAAVAIARAQAMVEQARKELAAEREVTSPPTQGRKMTGHNPYVFCRPRNVERWRWRLLRRRLRRKILRRVARRRRSRRQQV